MLSSQREKKASAYLYKHREAYGVDRNSVHVLEQSIENVALAYIHNYYPAASYTKAPFAVTHTNSFSCIFFLYNFFFAVPSLKLTIPIYMCIDIMRLLTATTEAFLF